MIDVGDRSHDVGTVAELGPEPAMRSPASSTLWVRRCVTCGGADLGSAYGQASIIEDRAWSCRRCGAERWQAQRLVMPGRLDIRCPYLQRQP